MTKRIDWKAELSSRWGALIDMGSLSRAEAQPYIHAFVHLRTIFGEPIGEGKDRIVFLSRDRKSVIKMPRCANCEIANERELHPNAWLEPQQYARTWRDDQLSDQTGILIIRMEHVRLVVGAHHGELPDWASAVDCSQVGYNAAGNLVAYDWGG